jgi:hypothetical protein
MKRCYRLKGLRSTEDARFHVLYPACMLSMRSRQSLLRLRALYSENIYILLSIPLSLIEPYQQNTYKSNVRWNKFTISNYNITNAFHEWHQKLHRWSTLFTMSKFSYQFTDNDRNHEFTVHDQIISSWLVTYSRNQLFSHNIIVTLLSTITRA